MYATNVSEYLENVLILPFTVRFSRNGQLYSIFLCLGKIKLLKSRQIPYHLKAYNLMIKNLQFVLGNILISRRYW